MAQTTRSEPTSIGSTYQMLLLMVVVLGVYFPVLHAGLNSIDDTHIVEVYGLNGSATLRDILLPGHRFYYRPLVELSFYLDGKLWGMAPSFMHLENVLVHTLNTLLLYLLAKKAFSRVASTLPALPFLTALLFALHPVNVEAVSWIAGRTDPLATIFVLSAAIFLAKALEEDRARYLYLSVFLLLLGALAKEVAVCFLPLAVAMIFCWPRPEGTQAPAVARRRAFARSLPFLAASLAIFALFLCQYFMNSGSNGMLKLFKGNDASVYGTFLSVLQTFGFYVKKLLVPVPLNFAIVGVNGYHALFGLAAACLLIFFARRQHLSRFFLAAGFFLIIPALVAAVCKIAWTPVAERYLYLPSAFFSLGLVGVCDMQAARLARPRLLLAGLAPVLALAAFFTVQRNFVWLDNVALYRDAVAQSPEFGALRNELGVALIKKGETAEALRQLEIGQRLHGDKNTKLLMTCNQLVEKMKTQTPEEASTFMHLAVPDKEKADSRLLVLLRNADIARLSPMRDKRERSTLTRDIIDTNDHIFLQSKDPVALYNNGQLALAIGDRKTAGVYLERAYRGAPEGAHYKKAAKALLQKLGHS